MVSKIYFGVDSNKHSFQGMLWGLKLEIHHNKIKTKPI